MAGVLAIAVHMAVVHIPFPAVAIFFTVLFLEFFLKIRVRVRIILGKVRGEEGVRGRERPNILNIVASKNYLTSFDSQQLATLFT